MFEIICSLIFLIVAVLFYFPLIEVKGNSMFPTFEDGQYLHARRITRFDKLKVGAVYVFYSPKDNKVLIKRLNYIIEADFARTEYCYFLGDNAIESNDSRHFGYVSRKNIIAVVL